MSKIVLLPSRLGACVCDGLVIDEPAWEGEADAELVSEDVIEAEDEADGLELAELEADCDEVPDSDGINVVEALGLAF